jgi:hypothetical protein
VEDYQISAKALSLNVPDLKHIAEVLLKEKLIDEEDIASRRFSISARDTPLPFDQVWGTYRIRLNIAEDQNSSIKDQLVRFVNDLEKHKGLEETLKLVSVKGSKRNPFVFMDAGYSKVICYIFVKE